MSLTISPNLGNPIVNTELEFVDSSSEYKTQPNLLGTTTATPTLTVIQGNSNIWIFTAGSNSGGGGGGGGPSPAPGDDSYNELQQGYVNYDTTGSITITFNFPYYPTYQVDQGVTTQTDWQQRYENFVASDLVGKLVRFVDPNNFATVYIGGEFNTTFSKVIAADTSGMLATDSAIKITLDSSIFNQTFTNNNPGFGWGFSMGQLADAGVYLEVLSEIISIPTNIVDTTTIPTAQDIININGYSEYTNELTFVGNQIKMSKSLYASTTAEPESPTATVLTTISAVTSTTELATYGSTTDTNFWFNNVAPMYPISIDFYAMYFEHNIDFYGPGLDRVQFSNNSTDPAGLSFLQAIYDNNGGKIAIKHPGNVMDPEFTHPLVTYEVMTPVGSIQQYSGPFVLKLYGNLSSTTPTSNYNVATGWGGWGFASSFGGVQLEKTATLLTTPIDVSGVSLIEQSALTQTKVTTFYFGASNVAVPSNKLTGTATGIRMNAADFTTYFPSGISAGSQVKYYTKTTSIPSGSQITYKNKLEFPIKLYNRQNIMSSININDKYAKITVGDDDYITVKYDTLTHPEWFTNGKIIWNGSWGGYVLAPDFFSALENTQCIFDYADMYYESPSYTEFSSTRGATVGNNTSPYVWKGNQFYPSANWYWPMRGYITNGGQSSGPSQVYLTWSNSKLLIGSDQSGNHNHITTLGPMDQAIPRIIITLRFRPIGE